MRIRSFKSSLTSGSGMLGLCAAVAITMSLTAASKDTPIKKLTFDPKAETVELFDGIEKGALEAKLIHLPDLLEFDRKIQKRFDPKVEPLDKYHRCTSIFLPKLR